MHSLQKDNKPTKKPPFVLGTQEEARQINRGGVQIIPLTKKRRIQENGITVTNR